MKSMPAHNKKAVSVSDIGDDYELLEQISKGNKEAFSELYLDYQPRLLGYCSRVLNGDTALAADIVDEALFDVWRYAGKFASKSKPSTWIHSITHNKLVSFLRKNSDSKLDKDLLRQVFEDIEEGPEKALENAEVSSQLVWHMGKLSSEHREVLLMAYFRELSIKDISTMLAISENTVKTRMFHARKKMKQILTRAGVMREGNG
jgi:RNA polymerase sigma-70 factor (ECF subfamily)